jgi:hypothetical protein
MKLKYALIALMTMSLAACGGGDGDSSFALAPDLTLTVRIDGADVPGLAATIGPTGASIVMNSGQRLEIGSSTPVVFTAGSSSATSSIRIITPLVWDAVISTPVDTAFTLTATSAVDATKTVSLAIRVLAQQ